MERKKKKDKDWDIQWMNEWMNKEWKHNSERRIASINFHEKEFWITTKNWERIFDVGEELTVFRRVAVEESLRKLSAWLLKKLKSSLKINKNPKISDSFKIVNQLKVEVCKSKRDPTTFSFITSIKQQPKQSHHATQKSKLSLLTLPKITEQKKRKMLSNAT
jgi:hypothetical protein